MIARNETYVYVQVIKRSGKSDFHRGASAALAFTGVWAIR